MAQNQILRANFPSRCTFCPFFGSSFSDHKHVIQPFSFDFNFPARFAAHDALKGNFTARKASNIMTDVQDEEAYSVADRQHVEPVLPVRKIGFWIERTLVRTSLFFISLEGTY